MDTFPSFLVLERVTILFIFVLHEKLCCMKGNRGRVYFTHWNVDNNGKPDCEKQGFLIQDNLL